MNPLDRLRDQMPGKAGDTVSAQKRHPKLKKLCGACAAGKGGDCISDVRCLQPLRAFNGRTRLPLGEETLERSGLPQL
ncbi:hypothetical protein A8L50_22660 [Pantoea ananatis]|nr:hypothetical protein [Pantoea ananatis]NQE82121.1 hypothetical protein [Pantoea ananatis]